MNALSPFRIIVGIAVLIALATCHGAEPFNLEAEMTSKLTTAVKTGKAAEAAQWAAAIQSLQASELIRTENKLRQPVAGIVEAFSPQLAAVPAFIKRIVLPKVIEDIRSPAMAQAVESFVGAAGNEQAVAAVHQLVAAKASEERAATEVQRLTSGDVGLALAKSLGFDVEHVDDLSWRQSEELIKAANAKVRSAMLLESRN